MSYCFCLFTNKNAFIYQSGCGVHKNRQCFVIIILNLRESGMMYYIIPDFWPHKIFAMVFHTKVECLREHWQSQTAGLSKAVLKSQVNKDFQRKHHTCTSEASLFVSLSARPFCNKFCCKAGHKVDWSLRFAFWGHRISQLENMTKIQTFRFRSADSGT